MAYCEKHGEYESKKVHFDALHGLSDPGIIIRPAYDLDLGCPQCADEAEAAVEARKAEEEAKELERQAEEAEKRRLYRFKGMNIEPAYFGANLDNFETPTHELQHALSRVRDLVAGKVQKIVMLGSNGTGKTHLACAAVQALGGRILTMYEISTTIRASYTPMANRDELEIVDELARLPLLAIDEIGRTKGSDTEANWLSYIIDKRHVRGLPLILISNKHARKDCQAGGCSGCLENYIGEDIMSRLSDGGVMLKFSGADFRKTAHSVPRGTQTDES